MRLQLFRDRPGEAYGSSVSHDFVLEIADDTTGPGHGWHVCAVFCACLAILAFCVAALHWMIAGTSEPGGRVAVGVGTSAYVIVELSFAIAFAIAFDRAKSNAISNSDNRNRAFSNSVFISDSRAFANTNSDRNSRACAFTIANSC